MNGLIDFLHKTVYPKTYKCNLCAITFTYKMKGTWREFVKSYPYKITFVHLNHLKDYNLQAFSDMTPCCILKEDKKFIILLDKVKMSFLKNENDLINEMKNFEFK